MQKPNELEAVIGANTEWNNTFFFFFFKVAMKAPVDTTR